MKRKINHAEDSESMALWSWAQLMPEVKDHLIHIPNGGKRNAREAARFKSMGVRAGVSDYFLPIPRGIYHGLWIELKPGLPAKSRTRPSQIEWRDKMRAQGYYAEICVGWDRARDLIIAYMEHKKGDRIDGF